MVLVVWLGLEISDGLSTRERKVARMRKALVVLQDLRLRGGQEKPDEDVLAQMTTTLVPLETYVSAAAEKVGIAKPNVTPRPAILKDGFQSQTVQFEVRDVTLVQLKDLLEGLETQSKLVVVTFLKIDRKFREEEKEKLDARLEVSTFARAAPEGAGSGTGSGSAKKAGG